MNLATKSLGQFNRASILGILGVEISPSIEQDLCGKVPILGRIYVLNGHTQDSDWASLFQRKFSTQSTNCCGILVFTPPIKNIKKPPLMSRNVITSEHLRILRTSKHFQGLSEFTSKIYSLFLCPENTTRHLVQLNNLNPKTPKTQTGHVKIPQSLWKLC